MFFLVKRHYFEPVRGGERDAWRTILVRAEDLDDREILGLAEPIRDAVLAYLGAQIEQGEVVDAEHVSAVRSAARGSLAHLRFVLAAETMNAAAELDEDVTRKGRTTALSRVLRFASPNATPEAIACYARQAVRDAADTYFFEFDDKHGEGVMGGPITTGGWYENDDGTISLYRWADVRVLVPVVTLGSWDDVKRYTYAQSNAAAQSTRQPSASLIQSKLAAK